MWLPSHPNCTYVCTYVCTTYCKVKQHNRSSEQHTHSKPDTLQREGSTGYSDMKDGVFTGGIQEYHRRCSTCTTAPTHTHNSFIAPTARHMHTECKLSMHQVHTAVAKGHRKDYLTHTSPLNYVCPHLADM